MGIKIENLGKVAKQVLGTVAPVIATAVGGPFAPLAMEIIKSALGTDDEAIIEQKLANATPETLLALRQANQQFEVQMKELGIREDQLYLSDTADARLLARETGTSPQVYLTAGFLAIYAFLMAAFFVLDFELNDWQRGQLGILIGVITGAVGQIISFWFGTSKSSKNKDGLIADVVEKGLK